MAFLKLVVTLSFNWLFDFAIYSVKYIKHNVLRIDLFMTWKIFSRLINVLYSATIVESVPSI